MTPVAGQLRELRPRIVDHASSQVARGEGLRALAAEQIHRFFGLLEDSVESGSPEWLDICLQDWARARPQSMLGERLTLLPVLDKLKESAWLVVREHIQGPEALEIIIAMEPCFVHAQSFLAAMEVDALLQDNVGPLREAQEDLRRLEKSKSDFIAVAAHELKTPLTLIEGYADMLTDAVSGAVAGDAAQVAFLIGGISKGIGRLREIVDDLVDVSIIDNQMLSLSFQPVRLGRVLGRVRDELQPAFAERRLALQILNLESDDMVVADPQRLLQAFRHLLSNAVKYTPDGGSITVSARRRPGFYELQFADTGIGIALENQQRIFEKFAPVADVALHSTSKTRFKGGGTGLGLALVKGIVEAHGGAVWCESPGYDERACPGSTFHVMIPETPPADEALQVASALRAAHIKRQPSHNHDQTPDTETQTR